MLQRLATWFAFAALGIPLPPSASIRAQSPLLRTHAGQAAGDQLGASIAGLGDVDGDGVPDYAIGAPAAAAGGVAAGRVTVHSGRTGIVLWSRSGNPGDLLGNGSGSGAGQGALAAAGDVDGDGIPDVVLGAPGHDAAFVDAGRIWVCSGRTGAVLRVHDGLAAGEQFGLAVAGVGDLDRDGHADYAGGAPLANGPGTARGKARIYSGRTGALLFAGQGTAEGDHYGQAIAGTGDTDGDGYPDFLVTAPWSDQVASKCGSAILYSGRTYAVLHVFVGHGLGYEFGTSAAFLGDVDGDGRADLLIGEPENKVMGDDAGAVFVYSGATRAQLHVFYGDSGYDYFGQSIAAADIDGDLVPDIVVGAPFDERSGVPTNAGITRVFSGATGQLLLTIPGTQSGEQSGRSVASAGDLNGDGFAELLLGAPFRDGFGVDSGQVSIHCGRPLLPRTWLSGAGCPAARPLQIAYSAPARLSQVLSIRLQNGPPGIAPGYVTFGFATPPPPIDLAPLGLVGCRQYAMIDLTAAVLMVDGVASVPLTVAPALAPCGLAFWNQGAVLDATAPGGIAVSDLGRAVIAP